MLPRIEDLRMMCTLMLLLLVFEGPLTKLHSTGWVKCVNKRTLPKLQVHEQAAAKSFGYAKRYD